MRKRTPEDRARSEEIGRRLRERVARIEAELAEKAKEPAAGVVGSSGS